MTTSSAVAHVESGYSRPEALAVQPLAARIYIGAVIALGTILLIASFPTALPRPAVFLTLVLASCITSLWKVTLPLPLNCGSTLSPSYAVAFMALVLLGAEQAMLVGIAGVWVQCTFRVRYVHPWYRALFSMAAEAVTVYATAVVYGWLGGSANLIEAASLPKALVGVIPTYFLVNTGLVAGAIALTTRQPIWKVWRDNFLWSAPS